MLFNRVNQDAFIRERDDFATCTAAAAVACFFGGAVSVCGNPRSAFPIVALVRVNPTRLRIITSRLPTIREDWYAGDRDAGLGRVRLLNGSTHCIVMDKLGAEAARAAWMIAGLCDDAAGAIKDLKRVRFIRGAINAGPTFDIVRAIDELRVGVVDEIRDQFCAADAVVLYFLLWPRRVRGGIWQRRLFPGGCPKVIIIT